MRIIALQGKHETGKSTTLRALIKLLHKPESRFAFEYMYPEEDVLKLCQENRDLQYWFSLDGIKIGITTRGDARRYLHTDFYTKRRRNFSDRDIVVCAIRTYGGTVEFVNEHAINGLEIVQKDIVPDKEDKAHQEEKNNEQATYLYDKLKEYCKNEVE